MRRSGWGVLLAAVWAVGCKSSSDTGINAGDGGASIDDQTPITITFLEHGNTDYGKANKVAFDAYHAAHPNVTVKVTTIEYASLTATLLADLKNDKLSYDLLQVPGNWACSFAANLADVPADVLTPDAAKATFFTPQVEGTTCQGVLKGLPIEYNLEYGGVVLDVDKYQTHFPGKTPGWTDWASFIADASALAEFGPDGSPKANGLDIDPNWPGPIVYIFLAQILQHGGQYWSASGDTFDLSSQAAHDALSDIVSWVVKDKVMSLSLIPGGPGGFVATRLAQGMTGYGWSDPDKPLSVMGFIGTWGLSAVRNFLPPERKDAHYDYFAVPPMVGAEHKFVTYGGWSFAVPKTSKYQKVAWDIARSLALDPAAMKQWSATTLALPALRANATMEAVAGDPLLAKILPLLPLGEYIGHMPAGGIQDMEGAISSNVFAVARGEKNVDQALADIQNKTNEAFAHNK
jgi:ABC-type glycerol-3-phosphate transport system substrate-binding protein